MRLKEGFRMRPLGREFIVVPEGVSVISFNKMISLNSTSAMLWEAVEGKDFSVEDLTALLLENYEVEPDRAAADAARLAQQWIDAGVAE